MRWVDESDRSFRGFDDDGLFVAQVVRYDDSRVERGHGARRVMIYRHHWTAFVRGQPVEGRWTTAAEAQAAAEQAHDVASG